MTLNIGMFIADKSQDKRLRTEIDADRNVLRISCPWPWKKELETLVNRVSRASQKGHQWSPGGGAEKGFTGLS